MAMARYQKDEILSIKVTRNTKSLGQIRPQEVLHVRMTEEAGLANTQRPFHSPMVVRTNPGPQSCACSMCLLNSAPVLSMNNVEKEIQPSQV